MANGQSASLKDDLSWVAEIGRRASGHYADFGDWVFHEIKTNEWAYEIIFIDSKSKHRKMSLGTGVKERGEIESMTAAEFDPICIDDLAKLSYYIDSPSGWVLNTVAPIIHSLQLESDEKMFFFHEVKSVSHYDGLRSEGGSFGNRSSSVKVINDGGASLIARTSKGRLIEFATVHDRNGALNIITQDDLEMISP